MTSLDRQERQLLRQRGAGMRNIENGAFDLNVNFGVSREDRQLARQRGAGNSRQVDAIDFGLSFPTPRNSWSPSKSPSHFQRDELPKVSSPQPLSEGSLASHDYHTISIDRNLLDSEISHGSKRRRVSSRKASRNFFAIAEDDDVVEHITKPNETRSSPYSTPVLTGQENNSVGNQKISISPLAASANIRKQLQPLREFETPVAGPVAVLDPPPTTAATQTSAGAREKLSSAPKKRKKRRPVVLVKRKKRLSTQSKNGSTLPIHSITRKRPTDTIQHQQPSSPTDLVGVAIDKPKRQHEARERPRPSESDIGNDDQSYIQSDSSPEPPTPVIIGQQKRDASQRSKTSKIRDSQSGKESTSGLPILTYRMNDATYLPIIHEMDEDVEASSQAIEIHTTRNVPNALDVFGQICRETIKSMVNRVRNPTPANPSAMLLKRKLSAIQTFGDDIDTRCFDMSQAIETRSTLEARVRKSKRERAELQARWIEIRKQREQVALRCDQIRRQHWTNEAQTRLQWDLSQAVVKTELQLGKAGKDDGRGLEVLLRHVTGEVDSGILDCIKSFNTLLEAELRVFEGRQRRQ